MTEGSGRLTAELCGWLMKTAIEWSCVAQAASLSGYGEDRLAANPTVEEYQPE